MEISQSSRRGFLKFGSCQALALMLTSKGGWAHASSQVPRMTADQAIQNATHLWWSRFFIPEVQTFADYLSSYEPQQALAHLPTAEEVRRQFPNPCGYSTGMEDGLILGGAMLSALVDQHAVTQEANLFAQAQRVFDGIFLCATAHGVPGFLARNVCREDQKSIYINSSRDQYTHAIHGVWKFVTSPLCDSERREKAQRLMREVADRMIQTMVPENDYDFLRADGSPCGLGICKMWEVQSHEAARLPMIYAAAWDLTRDETYHREWRRYIKEAVAQSRDPGPHKPAYALLQMQCSLELLHALEPDAQLKLQLGSIMQHVADLGEQRFMQVSESWKRLPTDQKEALGPDWRTVRIWRNQKGYPNPQWGEYRQSWHLTREAGEASLLPLMSPKAQWSEAHRTELLSLISAMNYAKNSSCGIVYHLAAYWKAKRLHQL